MKPLEKTNTTEQKRNMGLHTQLSDSDSILIIAVVVVAKSFRYLHSVISVMLHTTGLLSVHLHPDPDDHHHEVDDVFVGSGLGNSIILCEQLSMNRESSYPVQPDGVDSDCVVCLNPLGEGDHVRELACGHVFHKDCFAGWLDQLNFNCPICREPLVQDDRVDLTRRRVASDLRAWFPFQ